MLKALYNYNSIMQFSVYYIRHTMLPANRNLSYWLALLLYTYEQQGQFH